MTDEDEMSEMGDGDKAHEDDVKPSDVSEVSIHRKSVQHRRSSNLDRRRSMHRSLHRFASKKAITQFSRPPPLIFQNSYRLTAKTPINMERIQIIMTDIIQQAMNLPENQIYHTTKASRLCMDIAAETRNRVRSCYFDRARIIVIVRMIEKFQTSCITRMGFLWGGEEDRWTSAEYSTNTFYLHAICYGVYSD